MLNLVSTDRQTITISTSALRERNSAKRRQDYAGNFAGLKLIFAGVCCDVPVALSPRRLLGHVRTRPSIQISTEPAAIVQTFSVSAVHFTCLPAMSMSHHVAWFLVPNRDDPRLGKPMAREKTASTQENAMRNHAELFETGRYERLQDSMW